MVYFLFGEDVYSLRRKAEEIKKNFFKSDPSGINFSELEGENIGLQDFINACNAMPFLSSKRMVIVKNLLSKNKNDELKKYILKNINNVSEKTLLFFVEFGLPDKRTSLYKALNRPKFSQEFKIPTENDFYKWINDRIKDERIQITDRAKEIFIAYLDKDRWRAENEINKLSLYYRANKKIIEEEDVNLLVSSQNNSNVFEFIDALAAKNLKKSLPILDKLIKSGDNEQYIFTMIIYQYRNILIVFDALENGLNRSEISKKIKMHPYVLSKIFKIIQKYKLEEIKSLYGLLQNLDYSVKQGKLNQRVVLDIFAAKAGE